MKRAFVILLLIVLAAAPHIARTASAAERALRAAVAETGASAIRTDWADARKHLALDPRLIAERHAVRLVIGEITKEPRNPLFTADKPWENALNNLYPNVVFDPERQCFRMWYKCVLADAEAIAKMMPPATVHDVGWFLLYAESADGLAWTKPELGIIGYDGSRQTNIVARDTPNAGVFFDPQDADAARRYKMLYDVGLGQLRVRFSPDGLYWSEPQTPQGFTPFTGDTHNNAFWDRRLGKYVAITRFYLGERLVARSESRDFLTWENTRLALRSTLDEGRARQLYCMPAFAYGSGYLALLMVYNVEQERTVDCELAWSPDTIHWQRVLPGTPLIPRGAADSYDGGCVYAQAGPPLLQNGRMMIFYGGSTAVHRGWKRHCLPCLAWLRPDGFAAYEPVSAKVAGVLLTAPLRCVGQPLQVSADAAGGSVRIVVLDEEGCETAVSRPITGEVTDAPVAWNDDVDFASWTDRTISLRLELRGARLFAIRGVELVDDAWPSAAPQPVPETSAKRASKIVRRTAQFDDSDEGWQGLQRVEHRAAADGQGGFLRVTRGDGHPFAFAALSASDGKFTGNLQEMFGGCGVAISCRVRSADATSQTRIELFARDIAQWSYTRLPPPGKQWTEIRATLRYDWTDEQARAAGWQSAIHAFSWQETVRRVGKVVVAVSSAERPASFDLDEFTMQTVPE